MNQTIETIKNHRSIRNFLIRALDHGVLESLIESGQAASTSSFIQACSVIRVSDAELRDKFVSLSGNQTYIASASEFLVFCADLNRNRQRSKAKNVEPDFAWAEQAIAATVDVSIFAQNVVIAAESLGLGCCYIGGIRNAPDIVVDLLELPDLVYPVFGLCIGYPDQNPELRPRLPQEVVLHQDKYADSEIFADSITQYDSTVKEYYTKRTKGKLNMDWSTQVAKQAQNQSRPFMLDFLRKQGFFRY